MFLTFFWIRGVTEATGASEQVSLTEKYFWIFFESEKIFVWSPQISPWGEKDVKVPDLQRTFRDLVKSSGLAKNGQIFSYNSL